MRRFLTTVGLFGFLQLVLFLPPVLLWYPGAQDVEVTKLKHQALEGQPSPRLILVGGSSVMMGVDSQYLDDMTPYHPVNLGLVSGLRLQFLLNEVDEIRPGDLIVLALEYQNYVERYPQKRDLSLLLDVLEQRPESRRYLDRHHWKALLDEGALNHLGLLLRRALSSDPRGSMLEHYNGYGDALWHREAQPVPGKKLPFHVRHLKAEQLDDSIQALNEFHLKVQAARATVVIAYPPVPKDTYHAIEESLELIHAELENRCTIPILGHPKETRFPLECFFDDGYHLLGDAILFHTVNLRTQLEPYLEETPPGGL